jgi:hypothetical protein
MKKFSLILLFLIVTFSSYTQVKNKIFVKNVTREWLLGDNFEGIQIYFKIIDYDDVNNGIFSEFLLLKFVNNNPLTLKLSYNIDMYYDEILFTNEMSEEYRYSIVMERGDMLEPSLDDRNQSNTLFVRYKNYDNLPTLTSFKMKNLKIELLDF